MKTLKKIWYKIESFYLNYLTDSLINKKEKIKLLYGKDIKKYLKTNIEMLLVLYIFLSFFFLLIYLITKYFLLLLLFLLIAFFILPQNILTTIQFFIDADYDNLIDYLNKKVYLIALGMYQFIHAKDYITIFQNLVDTEKDKKLKKFYNYVLFNLKSGKDIKIILSNLHKQIGESSLSDFLRDLEIAIYEGAVERYLDSYIDSFFYTFDDRVRKYISILNSTLTSLLSIFILVNTVAIFYYLIFYNLKDALMMLQLNFPMFDLLSIYQIATFVVPPIMYSLIILLEKNAKSF